MASSSAYTNFVISQNKKTLISFGYSSILQNNPLLPFIPNSLSLSSNLPLLLSNRKLTVCSVAKIIPPQVELHQQSSSNLTPSSPNSSMFFLVFTPHPLSFYWFVLIFTVLPWLFVVGILSVFMQGWICAL